MKTRWVAVVIVVLAACVFAATRSPGAREVSNEAILAKLNAGKFSDAERLARERLEAVEAEQGAESLDAANVLDLLSEAMRQSGKGAQSEVARICERAVRVKEKALGRNHPGYAASLYQLGSWHYVNGDYSHAIPLLEQSLMIRERTLGPDNPDVASSLVMLGAVKTDMGNHAAAKALVERSLAIRERAGQGGPAVAEALSCLASILVRMGDYAAAEPMYRRAIDLWESAWGTQHIKVGTGWNNLSTLLYATGDYEGALECKKRALGIRLRALGPKHELVAWTRANIGMNLAALGKRDEARQQYRQAIEILEKRFGSGSPEVGWTLKRLGDTYLRPGQYQDAVPILERAVSNLRRGESPNHPDVAEAVAALGAARAALGDTASGNELNREAIATLRAQLGDGHPEVGFTLTQYAGALVEAGATEPALEAALQGEDVSREHLRLTCRTMPERAALAYASSRPAGGRMALSILAAAPQADAGSLVRAWDSLIRSRTLVLDEMTSRMRTASEAQDPETRRLLEKLTVSRRHLANLIVSGPGETTSQAHRAALEKAREESEGAERALSGKNSSFQRDQERARIGFREVSSSLPSDAALVAYATAGEGRNRRYVAFVLKGGSSEASFVPLAAASRLEPAVTRWLSSVSAAGQQRSRRGQDPSRAWGDSLAELLWAPVIRSVGGAHKIFVVGDGSVLLVNFAALPVGRAQYLVETGSVFHYLASERDVVRSQSVPRRGSGLLALGDPAFDMDRPPSVASRAGSPKGTRSYVSRQAFDCADFQDVRFANLPNSGREVREVARLYGDSGHSTVLTGAAAGERAFKVAAPGHRVLHLATHGFFLSESCANGATGTRGIGATSPSTTIQPARVPSVNPIHLSGLALAGANERASAGPDDEDGILTAEEIAGMELTGTDWAVLSACDTGRGRIQVGEGVIGLRRAFQSAGVQTVIMSLWSVEDESTREWMEALYRARVTDGLSTADAVTKADLQVLQARRAQARSTDPFYWAAFVASGDWR